MSGWNFWVKNNFYECMYTHTTRPAQCVCFDIASTTKFACAPCRVFCHQCASFYGFRAYRYMVTFPRECPCIVRPAGGIRTKRLDFEKKKKKKKTYRLGLEPLRSSKLNHTVALSKRKQPAFSFPLSEDGRFETSSISRHVVVTGRQALKGTMINFSVSRPGWTRKTNARVRKQKKQSPQNKPVHRTYTCSVAFS